MNVESLKQRLTKLQQPDGGVDPKQLDTLMLELRDKGGLSAPERAALLLASSKWNDASKQRLLTHLSALDQKSAWVNLETARTDVREVQGRYAVMGTDIKGLDVKVGLFDNTFALSGKATQDGVLQLTIEGKKLSVPVKRLETPATILQHVKAQLPPQVAGVVIGGDARLHESESFKGPDAKSSDASAHLALYKPAALGLKPGEKPLRVVVTGYGKFAGIVDNPSANMAQKLAELGINGAIVEYRRLDVTHAAVNGFIDEMKDDPPDVILSMGVSDAGSQVEERPENVVAEGLDGNDQPIEAGVVREGAPQELKTDLPVKQIDDALKKFGDEREVATSFSKTDYAPDRSAYLCNYLGFNLANAFGSDDATTAGFVHVTDHTPADQMHALLESVVARQLDWRRSQAPTQKPVA